jgi:hypothetical protein
VEGWSRNGRTDTSTRQRRHLNRRSSTFIHSWKQAEWTSSRHAHGLCGIRYADSISDKQMRQVFILLGFNLLYKSFLGLKSSAVRRL